MFSDTSSSCIIPSSCNNFMVLGIDASRYGHEQSTGVEWYSFHLLNELVPLLGRDHNAEIRLYSPADFTLLIEPPFNVKKRIIPMKRLWTLVRLSLEMIFRPVDILFVPSHTLPLIFPKKSVITIHDVAFMKLKKSYTKFQYFLLHSSTRKTVRRAWKIIVPSHATKEDLIHYFQCNEEKIVVIPHGAPEVPLLHQWSTQQKQKMLEQFGLKNDDLLVLFVGRLETKKNLSRLIEGFQRFSKEFPGWKLLLAGKRGVGFEEIWKTVERLGLQQSVMIPGYITEEEKMFLLDCCRILAFPSLYEGFGLPVLEGFAHRRPVLTSNVSSMPEVAGGAAYLVNPEKVEEIGVGLKRLASDGILVTQLIQKGDQQLKKFDWEKTARATFDALFDES